MNWDKLAFGCVVHFCSPLGAWRGKFVQSMHMHSVTARTARSILMSARFRPKRPPPVTPSPFRRDGVQQLASHACGAKRVPVSRRSSHRTLLTLVGG